MSWSPGCVERVARRARGPGRCAATRAARRSSLERARQRSPRSRRPRPRRGDERGAPRRARHAVASGTGRRAARRDVGTCRDDVGLGGELVDRRARAPRRTRRRRRRPTRTSRQPSTARSTRPTGRLSSSSLASTTPSTGTPGSSSSDVTIGPAPGDGLASRRRRRRRPRTARAPRPVARGRAARAARSREHARIARRARSAAPRRTPGSARSTSAASRPRPAPASIDDERVGRTELGATRRRAARATSAPKSVPTSGLVTKSRPARPAPPPGREEPVVRVVERRRRRTRRTGSVPRAGSAPRATRHRRNAGRSTRSLSPRRKASSPMRANELRVDAPDDRDHRGHHDRRVERERCRARACRSVPSRGLAEPHRADHARVVEERDHRADRGDHTEHDGRGGARVEDGAEHHELGEPARERRDAGEREHEDRHHDGEHRARLARARRSSRSPPTGAARHRDHHRERAEVHRAVDQQVDDDGLPGRVAADVARHRERHEDEAALRDRRVGEHADDVGLAQRDEVAEDHRRRREDPEHRLPRVARRRRTRT